MFHAWERILLWKQTLTDAASPWRTGTRGASLSVCGSLLSLDEEDLSVYWWTHWSFPSRHCCASLHTPTVRAQESHLLIRSPLYTQQPCMFLWTNVTFLVGIFSFMNSASRQRTLHGAWIFTKPTPGDLVWKHRKVVKARHSRWIGSKNLIVITLLTERLITLIIAKKNCITSFLKR